MRKNVAVLSGLVFAMLLALSSLSPAKGNINTPSIWLEPTFKGFDDFYDGSVTAYMEGATARLGVNVDRDGAGASQVNITAVSVVFDWGGNYTLVVSPVFTLNDTIPVTAFTVTFTVPSTAMASNLFVHSYTVYVKYVTGGGSSTFTESSDSFAVYSATQANAQTLNQQVDVFPGSWSFNSSDARVLWEQAKNAVAAGDTYYTNGDFTNAVSSYQSSLDLFTQAFDAEKAYQTATSTAYNTALSNYYTTLANNAGIEANATKTQADAAILEAGAHQTEANAALKQVDAALTNAYGWMAIGIGWILIGVGAIVYGLRRPKMPAA